MNPGDAQLGGIRGLIAPLMYIAVVATKGSLTVYGYNASGGYSLCGSFAIRGGRSTISYRAMTNYLFTFGRSPLAHGQRPDHSPLHATIRQTTATKFRS